MVMVRRRTGRVKELNTEPFFLEDLIDTGESVLPAGAALH